MKIKIYLTKLDNIGRNVIKNIIVIRQADQINQINNSNQPPTIQRNKWRIQHKSCETKFCKKCGDLQNKSASLWHQQAFKTGGYFFEGLADQNHKQLIIY